MDVYSYFRLRDQWFIPRTPNVAITGIKKGLLPRESFISLSLFLFSPFGDPGKLKLLSEKEELQRLHELERILSKKTMDPDLEVMLIYTLNKLVEHKNPEIALFAAESINSIDNRYNKRIFELKTKINNNVDCNDISEIIKLLFNYGFINKGKEEIQKYYYHEALDFYSLIDIESISLSLQLIKIKILNALERFLESRVVVSRLSSGMVPDWQILLLRMEIEFEARNFNEILKLVNSCDLENFPDEFIERINLWVI